MSLFTFISIQNWDVSKQKAKGWKENSSKQRSISSRSNMKRENPALLAAWRNEGKRCEICGIFFQGDLFLKFHGSCRLEILIHGLLDSDMQSIKKRRAEAQREEHIEVIRVVANRVWNIDQEQLVNVWWDPLLLFPLQKAANKSEDSVYLIQNTTAVR